MMIDLLGHPAPSLPAGASSHRNGTREHVRAGVGAGRGKAPDGGLNLIGTRIAIPQQRDESVSLYVRCMSRRWWRRQQLARLAAICKWAMISHPVSVRKGHQRRQPSEKVERFKDEGGGPACMRPPPVPGASGRRKW